MEKITWTTAERDYPQVNLWVDSDGECECPSCHGRGSHRRRNLATCSPSDDFDALCDVCDGEGVVTVIDDRYSN